MVLIEMFTDRDLRRISLEYYIWWKNVLLKIKSVLNVERFAKDRLGKYFQDKITRVLNLWEKNTIFPPDVIKQLFQAHQLYGNTNEITDKCKEIFFEKPK